MVIQKFRKRTHDRDLSPLGTRERKDNPLAILFPEICKVQIVGSLAKVVAPPKVIGAHNKPGSTLVPVLALMSVKPVAWPTPFPEIHILSTSFDTVMISMSLR